MANSDEIPRKVAHELDEIVSKTQGSLQDHVLPRVNAYLRRHQEEYYYWRLKQMAIVILSVRRSVEIDEKNYMNN